ncbi:C40 family peptidase, partial [Streptosporangium algeriense]
RKRRREARRARQEAGTRAAAEETQTAQRAETAQVAEASGQTRGDIVANWALTQIDKPYVWASAGPSGYDCSGLTMRAWERVGVKMGHWTGTQWTAGKHVPYDRLQRGDLLFFGGRTRRPADIRHVGIYIGNGMMVHAPQTGDVVRVAPMWRKDLIGATRPA